MHIFALKAHNYPVDEFMTENPDCREILFERREGDVAPCAPADVCEKTRNGAQNGAPARGGAETLRSQSTR